MTNEIKKHRNFFGGGEGGLRAHSGRPTSNIPNKNIPNKGRGVGSSQVGILSKIMDFLKVSLIFKKSSVKTFASH